MFGFQASKGSCQCLLYKKPTDLKLACHSSWIISGEKAVKNFTFSFSFGIVEPIFYESISQ